MGNDKNRGKVGGGEICCEPIMPLSWSIGYSDKGGMVELMVRVEAIMDWEAKRSSKSNIDDFSSNF